MSFLKENIILLPYTKKIGLTKMDTKDPQIIQQNKILLGGQTINLRARQLIYVLASLMDKANPNAEITIDAKDFLNFVNTNSGEKWTDIYQLTNNIFDHLNKNPILIKEPKKKDFVKINWLSSLGVLQGRLKARFSGDIADFLLYKQGLPYTKLLWDLRPYKSNFTARIMDLFQRFHNKNSGEDEITFDYDVEELKLFFGVHDKYQRFFDFEKRVLEVTRKELEANDLAPYWFTYEKKKKGRNVKDIVFNVYLRPKVLLEIIPDLKMLDESPASNQANLFSAGQEQQLSPQQQKIYKQLIKLGLKKSFCSKILLNLTDSQATGYLYLLEYGVNRTLAFSIVKDYCSFGELVGYEHFYIKHSLDKTESARLQRIEENKAGKTNKRVTPLEKRGGLAKKVFSDKLYFPEFMERLSAHNKRGEGTNQKLSPQKNTTVSTKRKGSGTKSISDILNTMGK